MDTAMHQGQAEGADASMTASLAVAGIDRLAVPVEDDHAASGTHDHAISQKLLGGQSLGGWVRRGRQERAGQYLDGEQQGAEPGQQGTPARPPRAD